MKLECEMYAPVRDWLTAQGFKVFGEFWGHDVVGIQDNQLVCVELKNSATKHVFRQAMSASTFCQRVYIGVPTNPKKASLEMADKCDVGVLRVGDSVEVIRESSKDFLFRPRWMRAIEALKDREPDQSVIGGVPNLAGQGPAQLCAKRCAEYIKLNPAHGWKELFSRVHNHYAHLASMRAALGGSCALKSWKSNPPPAPISASSKPAMTPAINEGEAAT